LRRAADAVPGAVAGGERSILPHVESVRCRAPLVSPRMQPCQPSSERVAPAEAGTRWGTRFFAHVLDHLPAATPQVERRLLRSAYEIHRMTDAMLLRLTEGDLWRLVGAVETTKATADAAITAGVPEGYVRQLLAMTLAHAAEVADLAAQIALSDEPDSSIT
jgi:hypothetical protein